MSEEVNRVRLLPWTGAHGQPCLLLTDGDGAASRLADRIESVQLGLADRLLGRTRDVLAARGTGEAELRALAEQLADALSDALLIARWRGTRLGGRQSAPPGGTKAVAPSPMEVGQDLLAFTLLTLPGHDLASARAARHHVRDMARSWSLPTGAADDLESITAELVANALEHSDSRTLTVTCALTVGRVAVSVTDEGEARDGRTPIAPGAPRTPPPEHEHGRGLLITDSLAARWGSRQSGEGLTVWAEVLAGASKDAAR